MNLKKSLLTSFFSIFLFPFYSPATSPGGSGTRGGGDTTAAEFLDLARQFFLVLESSATISSSQKFLDMKFVFAKTQVFLSLDSKLDLDGVAVTAINIPAENKIIFSEPRWKSLTDKEKIRLIAHEFLGLAQADDSQYLFSNIMTMEYFYLLRLDLRDLNKGSYFVVNQDIEFALSDEDSEWLYFTERGFVLDYQFNQNFCSIRVSSSDSKEKNMKISKGTLLRVNSISAQLKNPYTKEMHFWIDNSNDRKKSTLVSCWSEVPDTSEQNFLNLQFLNRYLQGLLTLKVGLL